MTTTVKSTTKTTAKDVKVITFPQITIGAYDIIVYPASLGKNAMMYAMVYNTGTRKAVWETLSFRTVKQAQAAARTWIKEQ
jgi:hypothetical protein